MKGHRTFKRSRPVELPPPDASMSRGTAMRAARRAAEAETAAEASEMAEAAEEAAAEEEELLLGCI